MLNPLAFKQLKKNTLVIILCPKQRNIWWCFAS